MPISNVPNKYSEPELVVPYSFAVVRDSIVKLTDENAVFIIKSSIIRCFIVLIPYNLDLSFDK